MKQQSPKQFVRALIDKSTINKDLKQFDVVFATETPVFRYGWDENFNEILICNKANMRTQRLDGGVVPLLDNHNRYSGVTGQYGSVISWSADANECRATIQFSSRAELAGIWGDIEAGITKGISAGYIPWVYQREIVEESAVPNYRAIDWEVLEISLAPVPADYNSKVRSEEQSSFEIEIRNFNENQNKKMADEKVVVPETTVTQERSVETTPAKPDNKVVEKVDTAKIQSDAVTAERQRSADIRIAVRAAKLDEKFADELIQKGVTIDVARAQILDKMAAEDKTPNVRTANTGGVNISVDETEKIRDAMSLALQHRAQFGSVKLEGQAHDFKYMSLMEMARHMLAIKGDKSGQMSPSEVVHRAIATSDFPDLLNTTLMRTIRRIYIAITPEWQTIARKTTAKDFRTKTGIAVDGKVTFDEIAEGGEYKNSLLMVDDKATLKLKTFGRKITITRQAIINDDLSVFDRLPEWVAYGAADFQAAKVWGLVTGNAKTPDGVAMFNASHKNIATSGAVPTEALLATARTAMYRQKTPAGNPMGLNAKYLIVPMELMITAQKLITSVLSSANYDVNTMKDAYQIITSPYLQNAAEWYLAADSNINEGIVYAYLEGEEGLYIDKEINFDNDSIVTKARMDFDCAVWDYRGWYKNPGA